MTQHKIVKIPDWVTPESEEYLNQIGKDGWELVHLYNQHAYMKAREAGTLTSGSLNTTVDAFGRNRTSEPFTLGDYKHIYGREESDTFINKLSGNGSITNNRDLSSVTLSALASGSSAIHQSRMYHHYMPGKSQFILSSFVFGAAVSGSTKRTGYFDDYNGIFLEQDATGSLQFVIRSATNGTGSIIEQRVKQENWNVQTALSGDFVLDVTKSQLFYLDFQWLAVGRVRCGFIQKGIGVICHVFDHTNITDVAYMQNPNLPIRCEINNSITVSSSMEQICSTVMSEGGYSEAGRAFAVSSDNFRALSSGSTLPVLAIRLKNNVNGLPNRSFVRVQDASIFTDQQTIRYSLRKLPSGSALTTASAWTSVDELSMVEYNTSATALSDGLSILTGFVGANSLNPTQANPQSISATGVTNKQNFIAQNYDSTDSEIYVVVAKNMTATSTNVGGSIRWSEIY